MQYEVSVINREQPKYQFQLLITVKADMKKYLNVNESLFDDYGISKFLTLLRKDFMVTASECLDIKDLEKAYQESKLAGESHF